MTGDLRFVYPLEQADGVFQLAATAEAAVHLTADGRWMVVIEAGWLNDAIRSQYAGAPDDAWIHPEVELVGDTKET